MTLPGHGGATAQRRAAEPTERANPGLGVLASERWQLLALGVFALVTRLPLLAYPKACDDEQVYAVVGMEIYMGGGRTSTP